MLGNATKQKSTRMSVAVLIGFLNLNSAGAADLESIRSFDIAPQRLDSALIGFSRQADMQVIGATETLADTQTRGVSGTLSSRAALNSLLENTSVTFNPVGTHSVQIVAMDGSTSLIGYENPAMRLNRAAKVEAKLPIGGGSFAAAQSPAAAQTSAPQNQVRVYGEGSIGNLSEVVVTGSRVARSAFDMPTPVSVIDSAQIQQTGFSNIADVLTQLPAVGLGTSLSTAQFSDDAGASFANLRSLGTSRTLVLINGRRRVAGSSDSAAVDLSTIPSSLIERVEIITGGASAMYGADAVSGVINVILKNDFSGLEFSVQSGFAEHGGAESFAATLLGGGAFADDRGSFSFGMSHVREEPLFSDERSFTDSWISLDVNPLDTGPDDGIPDLITIFDFAIPLFHQAGAFFLSDGMYTVDPQLRPIGSGDGWDFGDYFQQRMRADTTAIRGNLGYRLNDSVEFVMESEFSSGNAYSGGAPNYDFGTVVLRDNPFIPADLGARMDADGLTELNVFRASTDQGIRDDDNLRDTYSILAGLQGTFGEGWEWQTFAQYGRYELTSRETNQRFTSRYLEAVDVISDPITGDPVCRSATARAAGCQPLNILGPNAASDEALAYYRVDRTLRVENTQTLAGAQLQGDLFELPAGPVASAFGIEYREDTRTYRDDPLAELGLLEGKAAGTSLRGEDSVSEAFVELVAPLLRDKKFAHDLQIEGAVRLSDYDSIGSTTAWKFGLSWSPVPSVRLRATTSQSERAPNLYELFSPRQISQLNMFDPCDVSQIGSGSNREANCSALGIPAGWESQGGAGQLVIFDVVGGGNPELDPETSDAWTAGVVIKPEGVPGLSIAVDYWNIEIDDAVQPLDVTTIVEKCVDSATIENVFCPRVTRETDFNISIVDYSIINVGRLSTDGVDIQAAYSFELGGPGQYTVGLIATYLLSHEELIDGSDPASLLLRRGEYNYPDWRGTLSLGYAYEALRVNLDTRVIGSARVDMNSSLETYDRPRVTTKVYNDLALGYAIGDRYDLRLTVNNLFDTEPPETAFTYLGGNSTLYDSIGRYFVFGVSAKF